MLLGCDYPALVLTFENDTKGTVGDSRTPLEVAGVDWEARWVLGPSFLWLLDYLQRLLLVVRVSRQRRLGGARGGRRRGRRGRGLPFDQELQDRAIHDLSLEFLG